MIKLTVNIIWSQNNIVRFKEGTRYTIKANKKEKYSNCVCAFGVSVILLQGLLDIKGKETSVKKVTMTLKTNNNQMCPILRLVPEVSFLFYAKHDKCMALNLGIVNKVYAVIRKIVRVIRLKKWYKYVDIFLLTQTLQV